MTVDPIAYSLNKLSGGQKGLTACRATAQTLVKEILASPKDIDDKEIARIAGITQAELDSARSIMEKVEGSKDMLNRMMILGSMAPAPKQTISKIADRPATSGHRGMLPGMSPEKALAMAKKMGADPEALKKMENALKKKKGMGGAPGQKTGGHGMGAEPEITKEQLEFATAVTEVERALRNVGRYRDALLQSPGGEIDAIVSALAGGFVAPTSGGDPVLNPEKIGRAHV